ncbi:T9SS type A sorting domain-containing protein [Aquimarina gracilis]|uniref:T9SS type A sorting domain-containing protein n=1 Tax=Aquimarina gracilis TaxID=874422 RepID=A0ABU5ZQZ2_9FLAO|nr:T9SS type A sorting domain-containing protein [Aquimarina gracilis]MEB3343997.1 T9SS type A sorting domain-containing protein [Aquimarina gracilis]
MKLKTTLIALFSYAFLFSQSFLEVQLPTPDKLSPLFIGSIIKSTIHYGAAPPNYNGKVIIFNHGYIDLNQGQFLFDNSFYEDTYNEGYQAVFVATTRGEGIWVNGKLLAESIDIVTDKYNVPQVYLVGHSNGGKASEAAMFQYGKKDKVTKAFALGTPFWGTYLADISQMPWLNWAWRLTGLNEGARTSTTYYCRDVVRPLLDNHPNNEPEKFVVLGASGFYKGSTLAAAAFLVTGGILFPIQGANDGVAPYSSTLRPGAEFVFEKNDSRAIFDHLDVGLGQFSWPYIKSYIENRAQKSNAILTKSNALSKIESDYYIIHSENEYDKIVLDKNSKYAVAEVLHQNPKATFSIFDANKNSKTFKSHTTQNHRTLISVIDDNLQLKSDSKFAAFIKQDNGIKMSFQQEKTENHLKLKVAVYSSKKDVKLPKDIAVRGILVKTAELDGSLTQNITQVIHFDQKNNLYYYDTKDLEDGVYSLFLNSESKGNFRRSIISGFTIGNIDKDIGVEENKNSITPEKDKVQIVPNSIKNEAYLLINAKLLTNNLNLEIYDITGKLVKNWNQKTGSTTQYDISKHIQSLNPGIYLLKVNNLKTLKFVKNN